MKLELKHIAPYLPYGLKGRVDKESYIQEEQERIGQLKTIDLADHNYELAIYGDLGYFLCYISDFKPILRPLSDLTKEITHNEEKFVPILKILEILKIKYTHYTLLDNSVDLVLDWKYHKGNSKTKENQKVRFWFNNFKGIGFYCTNMNLFMYKDIQGALNKLHEWHFDIFGLIEKGSAINFNDLQHFQSC